MKHIIKICKCNANIKKLIDYFHKSFEKCSTNYILTKKAQHLNGFYCNSSLTYFFDLLQAEITDLENK